MIGSVEKVKGGASVVRLLAEKKQSDDAESRLTNEAKVGEFASEG